VGRVVPLPELTESLVNIDIIFLRFSLQGLGISLNMITKTKATETLEQIKEQL